MANPYFNAKFYAASNPDLAKAGLVTPEDLWSHYVLYGAGEAVNGVGLPMRAPAPWYDAEYYFQANPDLQAANLTPAQLFEHFVTYGIAEGRAPREGFGLNEAQLIAYATANKDLRDAFGIEAAAPTSLTAPQQAALASHFFAYGYQEERPGAPYNAFEGNTYTVDTAGATVTGTNLDDTFNVADVANLVGTTVDGRFGKDVLNITGGTAAALAPTLKGIETINNAVAFATGGTELSLGEATGVQTVNTTGTTAAYTNASAQTLFNASNAAAVAVDVSFAGSLVGQTIKLGVTDAGAATFTSASNAGEVKAISLNFAAAATAATINAFTAVETITVTGAATAPVTVTANATKVKSFDASALKNGVSWTSGTLDNDAVVKGGAGVDTLTITVASGKTVTVDAGAGNDGITVVGADATSKFVITGGAGADTITLGAGTDTLVFNARGDSTFSARDVVTGFTAGTDKLDVKALNLQGDKTVVADTNVLAPSITSITEFSTTVENAFGASNAAFAVWKDAANTYVLADVNGDGKFNADVDFMVELVGNIAVTAADFVVA